MVLLLLKDDAEIISKALKVSLTAAGVPAAASAGSRTTAADVELAELAEELVEDEQQPYEAGTAFVENGMQSGDDTVLLMYMEQDAQ